MDNDFDITYFDSLLKSSEGEHMKKVIIIGSPGAGKRTFARKLRAVTELPLYYLDMLWHKSDQSNISKEEFDNKLYDILMRDQWIIDGNYQSTQFGGLAQE